MRRKRSNCMYCIVCILARRMGISTGEVRQLGWQWSLLYVFCDRYCLSCVALCCPLLVGLPQSLAVCCCHVRGLVWLTQCFFPWW